MRAHPRRRRLMATLLSAGVAIGGVLAAPAADAAPRALPGRPLVMTTGGPVLGVTTPWLRQFLGIPYGAAPEGDRRWQPPEPRAPWTTPLDASQFGPACPQGASLGTPSIEEDCLYLNVYTPLDRHGGQRRGLPVMVWIHGGAFTSGASNGYYPLRLATHGDAIVVTINYRLGALGFLAHPALSAESGYGGSGNYGLMDQQLALRWVRDNIARFGGNPQKVTIFGESAGGLSVHAHLASPLSSGLFQQAIAQSGAYALRQPPLQAAEGLGIQLASAVGCASQTADCLRGVSVQALLDAGAAILVPNVDGHVLPQAMLDAFANGDFEHVPVIEGSTADEYRLFVALAFDLAGRPLTEALYPAAVAETLAAFNLPPSALAQIVARYPASAYPSPALALGAVGTDAIFACPALRASRLLGGRVRTFAYEFADAHAPSIFVPPVSFPYGAYHGAELPYLFDMGVPLLPAQQALADDMVSYWTDFARRGSPASPDAPRWPRFRPGSELVQSLAPGAVGPTDDFTVAHQCDFWSSLGL